jgi:hypothetical protein
MSGLYRRGCSGNDGAAAEASLYCHATKRRVDGCQSRTPTGIRTTGIDYYEGKV